MILEIGGTSTASGTSGKGIMLFWWWLVEVPYFVCASSAHLMERTYHWFCHVCFEGLWVWRNGWQRSMNVVTVNGVNSKLVGGFWMSNCCIENERLPHLFASQILDGPHFQKRQEQARKSIEAHRNNERKHLCGCLSTSSSLCKGQGDTCWFDCDWDNVHREEGE